MSGASFAYSAIGGLGLGWFLATVAMLLLRGRWDEPLPETTIPVTPPPKPSTEKIELLRVAKSANPSAFE